ncbi:hypothetical protein ACH5RR_012680 [Cinchona calisaya]|uniref:Uncharacterized protein n=1 Tax=Cinchona calisaya TaxID=153742 RepID=A0ABD3A8I4_9GENT
MTKKAGNLLKTLHKSSFLKLHRQSPQPQSQQMDLSEFYCYKPSLKWNPKVEELYIEESFKEINVLH